MLLYYITDRHAFPGTEAEKRVRLLTKIAEAAQCGVDFIQLREKDLTSRELERLARQAVQVVLDHAPLEPPGAPYLPGVGRRGPTRLLINSRTDVALAVGADGVHLTSTDVAVGDVQVIVATSQGTSACKAAGCDGKAKAVPYPNFLVAVSCHSADEVRRAAAQGADFAVFAPVFEKRVSGAERGRDAHVTAAGTVALLSRRSREEGLTSLKAACEPDAQSSMPVLALGGITLENPRDCIAAGAAGIAAIRLFQDNNIAEVVRTLRTS